MNIVNERAPNNYDQWIDLGRRIIPCLKGTPEIKRWSDPNLEITKEEWKTKYQHSAIALRLDEDVDFDIDNPLVKRFIEKYIKSCGAISGRPANPSSHYWWKGKLNYAKFALPKQFEELYKKYPHGATLCEIRSGNGFYTIVPKSLHSKANEYVEWEKYEDIKHYPGDLDADLRKVALSTALSILYAPQGNRDEYCTAIAGVLNKHTEWTEQEINDFIFNIAEVSDDNEAQERSKKGTTTKKSGKAFGMPKIAQIWNCDVKTVAEIFSWIGIKYETVQGAGVIGDIIEYSKDRYEVQVFNNNDGETKEIKVLVDGPTLMKANLFYDEVIRKAQVWLPRMKPADYEKIMKIKFDQRRKTELEDYIFEEDATEDTKFIKHFIKFLSRDKVYVNKQELADHQLCYYEKNLDQLHININRYEDYLEEKRINIKRVDLIKRFKDIFKAKKVNGKYKGKSCVSWVIQNPSNWVDIKAEGILLEAEDAEIITDVRQLTYET
jgi:hypothetical protein